MCVKEEEGTSDLGGSEGYYEERIASDRVRGMRAPAGGSVSGRPLTTMRGGSRCHRRFQLDGCWSANWSQDGISYVLQEDRSNARGERCFFYVGEIT